MAATRPETLTITYPGGAFATIGFDELPATLQSEILRQPFAATPSPGPEAESYVLLEWEDGWKEVMQVDAGCTGFRRYYVISRTEEVGRLSLEHESGYPVLLEIERRPGGLSRVTFGETFALSPERSAREGNKTDTWYSLAPSGDAIAELRETLSAAGGDAAAVDLVAGYRQQDLDDFLAALA